MKKYNVLIVEHSGGPDLVRYTRKIKNRFKSKVIGHTPAIVLMGHGSSKAVKAGYESTSDNYLYPEDLKALRSLLPADKSNRRLFIDGCRTAESVDGFAKKAAEITGAYATGATGDATKSVYEIDSDGQVRSVKLVFKGAGSRTFAPDGTVANE